MARNVINKIERGHNTDANPGICVNCIMPMQMAMPMVMRWGVGRVIADREYP